MPMYDYKCASCGHRFTKLVWKSSSPEIVCPECGSSDVDKQVSGFASIGSAKSGGSSNCGSS